MLFRSSRISEVALASVGKGWSMTPFPRALHRGSSSSA